MRSIFKSRQNAQTAAPATGSHRSKTTSSEEVATGNAQAFASQACTTTNSGSSNQKAVDSNVQEATSSLQLQRNSQETSVLRNRVAELEAALKFADGELRTVKDREQKLLDKILDKSLHDNFYDSDLIHSFRNIREAIKRLAHNPLYATNGESRRPWVDELHDDHDFYDEWYQVPRKEKQLLSRKYIFDLLCDYVFQKMIFGVSASETATRNDKARFRQIEESLSCLEDILLRQGVAEDVITDWRVTTLKCIRLGHLAENPEAGIAKKIYRRLERLTRDDLSTPDLEKLEQRFSQLCHDAVKLRLLMRSSQERYECLEISPGVETARVEDLADISSDYNCNQGPIGHRVEFTMFAALVKYPLDQGEGRVVLEKAEVVVAPVSE